MVAQNIAFGIIAAVMAFAAVRVVTTDNVVHAALWLVAVLGGAAGIYVLLFAEFVAAVQVLVYIGAIVVLFLFGTMLTRAQIGRAEHLTGNTWGVGLAVSLVLAATLGYVLVDHFGADDLPDEATIFRTADVSDSIFSTYLLPFEVISVVLLAALIGAIVLARRD